MDNSFLMDVGKQSTERLGFIDLINESVHTSDDVDIGDIDAVNNHFIVVKRGLVNIHYYYIPIIHVEGWDGNVLWLKIKEDTVKSKYERDKAPNSYRYYVRYYPYSSSYYPLLQIISSKHIIHRTYPNSTNTIIENSKINLCDLCNNCFKTENELSNHISKDYS